MRVPAGVRRVADGLLLALAATIPLSTSGMQAAVIGLGVLAAVAAVAGWGVVRRTPLDGVLVVFAGALALSTLASGRPLEAVGWGRPWVVLAYFVVFWWLRDRAQAVRLVRVLVGAAAVAALYGIVQHFTGVDWYRGLLGRETVVRLREPDASGFAVVGFFRSYLTFAHAMLIPLTWAAALALRGVRLGLVAAPLLVTAIVFSTARGAWLGVVAGGVVLVLVAPGVRWARTVAALAAAAAVAFAVAPDLRAHALHMFSVEGANAGRIGIYRVNLDIVRAHPVLGLGFGRYQRAAAPYYVAHPEADRRSHAHSDYLQMAAEAGLVGLAAFGLLFATALLRGWPALAAAPDGPTWAAAAGAWVGVITFLVGGLTQYNFGDNEVALGLWTALAVLMRCREP